MTTSTPLPLIVTADLALTDDLLRLAAAAGVVPEVVDDTGGALRSWSSASLVLVGADLAAAVAAESPPRRTGVHLVTLGAEDDGLYRAALECAAESVRCLPSAAESLVAALSDCAEGGRGTGRLVGVIGGAGGVGATVFACALAEVIAGATDVLLLDADPAGAGADRVLGIEAVEGVRWDGVAQSVGRLSARSLYDALPRRGRLSVLTWPSVRSQVPVPPVAVRAAVSAGRRGHPVVVADLSRQADPVVEDLLLRCDQVLLVSTTTVPAVSVAARVVQRLPASTQLVLRDVAGGVAPAEVGRLLGVAVTARMRDQRGLDEAIGLGLGPLRTRRGPLARAARDVAAGLAL